MTNENDKSIIIQDLYAKIELDAKGNIPTEDRGFTLNRATYPMEQWVCGYMHSHISNIPKGNLTSFQSPCLGTGPINNTVLELKNNCDSTEWMLFCQELSMYVTVESLRGGPYIRMETIGSKRQSSDYTDFKLTSRSIREVIGSYWIPQDKREYFNSIYSGFIPYYLEHGHLPDVYMEHLQEIPL